MCYKGVVGFIGVARPEFREGGKEAQSCCFSEALSDLSVEEEVTKYGYIRIKSISFLEMFKNLVS